MPYQWPKTAPVGVYRAYHLAAKAATEVATGVLFDGTATAVAAPGAATVTLTTVDGDPGQLAPGDRLACDTGGSFETVVVTSVTVLSSSTASVTATFANTHAASFPVRLSHGTYLGAVTVNAPGTSMTLTLYDGHPSDTPAGRVIGVITLAAGQAPFVYNALLPRGCYLIYNGTTAGDLTVTALPALR